MTGDNSTHWLRDESVLAEIGAELFGQSTGIEVRLPRRLADTAVEAWHREDGEASGGTESEQDRVTRHRAAALALIGAALEDRARHEGDDVVVELDASLIGDALHAADDQGLITR